MANRRRRRWQLIAVLVVLLAAAGIFIAIFCIGPTGLFGLRAQSSERARLESEVNDLKVKATVLKSDIDDYHNPEKVKQLAKDRLQMTEPAKRDSGAIDGTR
jgi:cell division protein FtsB